MEEIDVPAKDASGRELSDLAIRVMEAVATNDGEATASEIAQATGDDADAVKQELAALVRTGHLAGPPRAEGEVSYGLLPAGRVALRLS
jgi:DNA-binding IclR family transcriptional regulator